MFKFGIYEPTTQIIDPMGSVIVNTNATGAPNFEWIYVSQFGGYGLPSKELSNILPYSDSVSYKVKLLDRIPKLGGTLPLITTTTTTTTSSTTSTTTTGTTTTSTSTTTSAPVLVEEPEDLLSLASSACYSNNSNVYQNCLSGPYRIGSKLYYVDFRVLYLVNLGDQPIYSPIFSVDTRKCNEDYGIFIGVPKVLPNFIADSNSTNNRVPMFLKNPQYSNQLNFFNESIEYKFTVIKNNAQIGSGSEITETLPITKFTIPNLVSQVAGIAEESVSSSGQTSIVAETVNSTPIYLDGSTSELISSKSFYPFVLFRYISATAQTAPVEIAFTVAPNIG